MDTISADTIRFDVRNIDGSLTPIELPGDINLTLMEILKAADYPIEATCGGMALCATCHIEILKGEGNLGSPNDIEMDMLDTLPNATTRSRLACQIRLGQHLNGIEVALKG